MPDNTANWAEALEAIGTCVGAVGTIGALIFLWLQVRDVSRGIAGSTYQNIYDQMMEIDRFFIEHPELKPYFYPDARGKKIEVNSDQLHSTVEMLVDYFDNVYHQQNSMPPHTFWGFSQFMRRVYQHSDVMQIFVREREEWYPADFVKHLRQKPDNNVKKD